MSTNVEGLQPTEDRGNGPVVHFPRDKNGLTQDREYCEVVVDGDRRRIRFHDYEEIYTIPGLYERIFYEELKCESPETVCGLLHEQLTRDGVSGSELHALDVGAGNGMVGEEIRRLGAEAVVGVDIIGEAARASERDRPGVYDDYVVCDLTRLSDEARARLSARPFNCLTTVAALGFADIPPKAFAEAYNLIGEGGWIAFNIKEDFLDGEDQSGFRRLIARLMSEGLLEERASRRYRHRLSMDGEPLRYVALVAVKHGDVPADWTLA